MAANLQCLSAWEKSGGVSRLPHGADIAVINRSGYSSARVGLLAVRPSLIFPSYTSGGAQEGAAALTRGSIAAV